MDKISSWLGKMPETMKKCNKSLKQVQVVIALFGHDAVTCCALADSHFTIVSLLSCCVNVWWDHLRMFLFLVHPPLNVQPRIQCLGTQLVYITVAGTYAVDMSQGEPSRHWQIDHKNTAQPRLPSAAPGNFTL